MSTNGWSLPDISLEDLLNLIKGFVDITILLSGYQSSGLEANWDSSDIKKALQWGLFFEDVFRRLGGLDDHKSSLQELDARLLEIKSNPCFPQGLSELSSATLCRAGDFVVRHVIHTLPLRDAHLSAMLTAIVEMDLDDIRRTRLDCLNVYFEKMMLQSTSDVHQSRSAVPEIEKEHVARHSKFVEQELSKRLAAVSCVSSIELGLDILSESTTRMCKGTPRDAISLESEERFIECAAWMKWRSNNLSYLLESRTARLVSGAKLIFSVPKVQWVQVFDQLKGSNEVEDDSLEMIEILLLGCVSSRWTRLIEHFLSVSRCFLPISNQYQELQNLPQERFQLFTSEQENDITVYLIELLSNQLQLLWKVSPILVASAIPSWSPLFRLYMCEIETQFKGVSSKIRSCSCIQDGEKHIDCELGERIRCLHAIHIQGSHLMDTTNNT